MILAADLLSNPFLDLEEVVEEEIEPVETERQDPGPRTIKISKCRTQKILMRCPVDDMYYAVQAVCHDRLCQYCGRARAMLWYHSLKEIRFQWPMFITLTMIPDCDLNFLVNLALKSFAALRRKFKVLKKGVYSIEINYSPSDSGKWYVHLHILADCRWVEGDELEKEWRALTGAYVTKIKRVRTKTRDQDCGGVKKVLLEVCKYTVKGLEGEGFEKKDIEEIGEAIHHRRLINTWGIKRSILDTEEISLPGLHCPKCHARLKFYGKVSIREYLEGKYQKTIEDYPYDTS